MSSRRRGDYYATVSEVRADGKRFGREVARQAHTLKAAMRTVEAAIVGSPDPYARAYVQRWDTPTHRRYIVAERDEAGNWWAPNPYDGTLLPLDAPRQAVSA